MEVLNQQVVMWQDERTMGVATPEAITPTSVAPSSEYKLDPTITPTTNGTSKASTAMEAQGWQVNGQGQLELLAAIDQRTVMQAYRSCHQQ